MPLSFSMSPSTVLLSMPCINTVAMLMAFCPFIAVWPTVNVCTLVILFDQYRVGLCRWLSDSLTMRHT